MSTASLPASENDFQSFTPPANREQALATLDRLAEVLIEKRDYHRLFDARIRLTSKPTDIFILLFIYFQLILGIVGIPVSLANDEGTYMLVMAEWARNILLFQPGSPELLSGVPWIYKIHLAAGMTLFLLTPFTRLVHVWSAPIWYLFRPGYQIVRRHARLSKEGI